MVQRKSGAENLGHCREVLPVQGIYGVRTIVTSEAGTVACIVAALLKSPCAMAGGTAIDMGMAVTVGTSGDIHAGMNGIRPFTSYFYPGNLGNSSRMAAGNNTGL